MAAPELPASEEHEGCQVLTVEEGWELLDKRARYFLGISGREFVRRWQAGEYPDPDGTPVMNVLMALPFVGFDPFAGVRP